MTFDGRVALVTGSTRGIGWAVAELLAERGATVVVNGASDADLLRTRVADLRSRFGGAHTGELADVGDPAAAEGLVKAVFSAHRRLDVLVNNAGVLEDALLGMIRADMAERVFAVNALGALHVLQAATRLMRRGDGGAIVNVSSIMGIEGNAGETVYSGSKAALVGITKSAAKELAPLGIRVNAVAPGFIKTDMTNTVTEDIVRDRIASIALGRAGAPSEVAEVIAFLASDAAGYVTGEVLLVDGGMVV
jgi:3-oxoacyl-[acyl-carrier protein] reductase